ncbi:MAG: universal stress protein [Thermoleophilia bacterium]|jgi:nucleotide-binding universal stress UspA family protein
MYAKILVATDGSKNAVMAVESAAEVARLAGSTEVLVVHVCPACTADLDPDDKNRELAEVIVQDAGKVITEAGIPVRTRVEIDASPDLTGTAIADIAKEEDVDLIVLGSRGLSEFKGMLLGSVSNKVLQKSHCPVLVIKDEEE